MLRYVLFNKKGSVRKGTGFNYPRLTKNNHLFVFLTNPTKDEIEHLSKGFSFDKVPLTTFYKEVHSRRYITVPFQFVMKSIYLENNKIQFANLLFVLMNNCLIVASSKESKYYNELVDHLFDEFKDAEVRSIIHIFSNFLQEDVDENYEVLGSIEERIKEIELKAATFEREVKVSVEDIIFLKSQLFKLSRQFWAVARVISLIRMGVAKIVIDTESVHLLLDIHETFLHQIDVAAAQKEMLSDALNVYATGITTRLAGTSNELNKIVKRLTAFSIILIAPTVVTGIYGMNFRYIPLSANPYGFYIITGAVISIMAGLFVLAKKMDWL